MLSPKDAQVAVKYGVDGVIVSNHGGRQLDHSPSALDMLPGGAELMNQVWCRLLLEQSVQPVSLAGSSVQYLDKNISHCTVR